MLARALCLAWLVAVAAPATAKGRAGAGQLARILESGTPQAQARALGAAPLLDDAWTLLPLICQPQRLTTPDGARAAARIAHGLRDPVRLEELEVDADVVDDTRRACATASLSSLPAAVRGDLLACAVDLGAPVPTELVFAADPGVRAAAVSLLAVTHALEWRDDVRRAAADDEQRVPAAWAALCAADARRTMSELDGPSRTRLRALALDPAVDAGTAEHLVACLRQSTDAKDRAATRKRVKRP